MTLSRAWSRSAVALVVLAGFGACRMAGPVAGRASLPEEPGPVGGAGVAVVGDSGRPVSTPARRPAPRSPAPTPPRIIADAPPLPREFRGVWVASVANIDWPSKRTLTTAEQQAELRALLDRAAALKLNAVIFQVRPAADALYASKIEPWSEYLTGTQGKAPDPYWDPLEFAVREAHARNLELHAWFNPYRARHTGTKSPLAASHIGKTDPLLVKPYAGYLWMDPGEPAVRARTLQVVVDVVRRYDVDGVHLDDYFYPYPELTKRGAAIPFPDEPSWTKYRAGGGALDRGDWRRRNVDLLVQALHDSIHAAKPWVRFGISPFGIWRPGYPAQVRGLDAYDKLYADARKWLREGWLDYFTPQLYWPTTKVAQAYPALLAWWANENVKGRHLWPGNFTSRAGATGSGGFPVSELVEQIAVTRRQDGATGNVHFSMKSFLTNQAGMNDSLAIGPYAAPALVPATPWLRVEAPALPLLRVVGTGAARELQLSAPARATPWRWVVRTRADTGWTTVLLPGTATSWPVPRAGAPSVISVTALNRVGTESAPVSVLLGLRTSSTTTPPSSTAPLRGQADVR